MLKLASLSPYFIMFLNVLLKKTGERQFLPPTADHGRKIKGARLLARSAVFLFEMVDED